MRREFKLYTNLYTKPYGIKKPLLKTIGYLYIWWRRRQPNRGRNYIIYIIKIICLFSSCPQSCPHTLYSRSKLITKECPLHTESGRSDRSNDSQLAIPIFFS